MIRCPKCGSINVIPDDEEGEMFCKDCAIVFTKELDTMILCPECGSSNVIPDYNRGEMFCKDCGLVFTKELLDSSPGFTYNARDTSRQNLEFH